jgi:hypothetical protein
MTNHLYLGGLTTLLIAKNQNSVWKFSEYSNNGPHHLPGRGARSERGKHALGAETLSVEGPRTERTQVSRAKLRRWAGQLRAGSSDEPYNTALDRNLAVEAAELAQARGLLRYWNSHEGVAWVIADSTRVNAIGRLLNGKPWRGGNKAKNLPGSEPKRPIGLREASSYERIALVEGGPDTISAFHHALVNPVHETLGVICMPSSNADFRQEDLEFVAGMDTVSHRHSTPVSIESVHRKKWEYRPRFRNDVHHLQPGSFARNDSEPIYCSHSSATTTCL